MGTRSVNGPDQRAHAHPGGRPDGFPGRPAGSMNPAWRYAAVALAAAVVALLWPLTAAISSGDALQVRLAAAAVAAIACAVLPLLKGLRSTVWIGIAVLSAAGAVGLLLVHFNASSSCVADYDGRQVIIGREFTPD